MPKVNTQNVIEEIAKLLKNGEQRRDIVAKFCKKLQKSPRTVDALIKKASEKLQEEQQQAEAIRVREMDATISEGIKEGLLSDVELEVILCRIASGGFDVIEMIKGHPTLRDVTPGEMIQAVRSLYQKRGSNAPSKSAITDTKGNDLPIVVTLNLG